MSQVIIKEKQVCPDVSWQDFASSACCCISTLVCGVYLFVDANNFVPEVLDENSDVRGSLVVTIESERGVVTSFSSNTSVNTSLECHCGYSSAEGKKGSEGSDEEMSGSENEAIYSDEEGEISTEAGSEIRGEKGETGGVSEEAFDAASFLSRGDHCWYSDRMNFVLYVFSGYTHCLRILQRLREEVHYEFMKKEQALRERELQTCKNEEDSVLRRSLADWESNLSKREAELLAREKSLEERFTGRLQEFLREIEAWGLRAPASERPPTPPR